LIVDVGVVLFLVYVLYERWGGYFPKCTSVWTTYERSARWKFIFEL